ncbi:GIY-YIG nuclease family protein [Gordonia tangerina]|uniref:GIY-YIG nuclease family protein n=1 Tax=Gordonia tangerina TaxID=2911060 RepID=A0ABS9DR33_9ACTN|nr:GIY-YIG nuclease family protein [Gordonia tangerina]MCF3940694.1 GIY-YIG nuclease family protein [Gordonia tangerina]
MSSRGKASPQAHKKPPKSSLPATSVREFRVLLKEALTNATTDDGRVIGSSKWGVYAFYDYDGEPIYVGQTKEGLATRVRRHLTNQRTDAVAMRILDTFEVAEVELWPLWDLTAMSKRDAQTALDAAEYAAYLKAIDESRFKAILNEKIPPASPAVELPQSYKFPLIGDGTRAERGHPDIRIARRAETIARLAAVAHERGEVSIGLRRVLVIQAVRLAYLAAVRLAFAEGRPAPAPDAISVDGLIGSVLYESDDEPDPDAD